MTAVVSLPAGKVFPVYLFALTGNFYSTRPVQTSDIAKRRWRHSTRGLVSLCDFMEETQNGSFGESVLK